MAKAKVALPSILEPSPSSEGVTPQLEVIEALNWYNANRTEKDAAKYLNCEPKIAKMHTTYAWITRMRSRGFKFSDTTEYSIAEFKDQFDLHISAKAPIVELDDDGNVVVSTTNVINLQERILAKTDVHIGELEGILDEYGYGEKSFNAYDWFVKNDVKPIHANKIAEYFRKRAADMMAELKEYPEYYEMPKSKIKSILGVMVTIVTDSERLAQNVNKARKPRKKKAVSFEKQVSKLKFKEKDDNFKIQSINPVNILGADQVWVFNVKTRRLGVYIALDASGLTVKGSTITNYSISSVSKTLRKPEKTLTSVLTGGKISLRKIMESINSKEVSLNGRLNKDTIILRAVK
jgi:hypothetical protein